jgi:hypothetical protein
MRRSPLLGILLLAACSTLPPGADDALRRLDPATADLAALRVAVDMPQILEPRPETARLVVAIGGWTGRREQGFPLEIDPDATLRAEQELAPPPGRHVVAFRLPASSLAEAEAFRRHALAERPAPFLSLGVASDACRLGPLSDRPLPFATFVHAPEMGRYVALMRHADLRRLVPGDLLAALPHCHAS